jgi:hypothetical protein
MSATREFPRLWTGEAVLDRALEVAGLERPKDGKNRKGHHAHRRRLAEFDRLIGSTPHADPLLTQARQHLVRLAEREARQRKRRHTISTTKESSMADRCIVEGHPHHSGAGCVIEGPREEPAKPVTNGRVPGIPEIVAPYLARFETIFSGPTSSAVLTHEAYRLAGVLLDCPEKDRVHIVARILFRLATRGAR